MPLTQLMADLEREKKRLKRLGLAVFALGVFILASGIVTIFVLIETKDTEECLKDARHAAVNWLNDTEALILQQSEATDRPTPQERAQATDDFLDSIRTYRSEVQDCVPEKQ